MYISKHLGGGMALKHSAEFADLTMKNPPPIRESCFSPESIRHPRSLEKVSR